MYIHMSHLRMIVSAMSVVTASLMPGLPSRHREAKGQVVLVKASAMAKLRCVRVRVCVC